jgi:hypothetical protein
MSEQPTPPPESKFFLLSRGFWAVFIPAFMGVYGFLQYIGMPLPEITEENMQQLVDWVMKGGIAYLAWYSRFFRPDGAKLRATPKSLPSVNPLANRRKL